MLARDLGHGEDDVVLGGAAHAHVTRREDERANGIADRPLQPQPRAGIGHGQILVPYSFQNEYATTNRYEK